MKFILLETVLIMGAIVFWTLTLPLAALFFVTTSIWQTAVALLIGEPFASAPARMSRAAA